MMEMSWMDRQLLASQEGLSSKELIAVFQSVSRG
jgi:hypothetical protein